MPVASPRKSSRLQALDSGFRRIDVAVILYSNRVWALQRLPPATARCLSHRYPQPRPIPSVIRAPAPFTHHLDRACRPGRCTHAYPLCQTKPTDCHCEGRPPTTCHCEERSDVAISLSLNIRRQTTFATATRLPRCARNDRLSWAPAPLTGHLDRACRPGGCMIPGRKT